MEFVEGETLEHLIRRSGRLEMKLALEITTQVAAGLAAVHEQNLVHRDIKPSNIMVRVKDDGGITAKIIDLGLAKAIIEPSLSNRNFDARRLLLERRILLVPNNSPDSPWIPGRISTRWA